MSYLSHATQFAVRKVRKQEWNEPENSLNLHWKLQCVRLLLRKFTYFGSLIRPLAADETSIEDGLQCIALQCSSKTSFDIKTRSSVVDHLSHEFQMYSNSTISTWLLVNVTAVTKIVTRLKILC